MKKQKGKRLTNIQKHKIKNRPYLQIHEITYMQKKITETQCKQDNIWNNIVKHNNNSENK
jgi:hypothetical protein